MNDNLTLTVRKYGERIRNTSFNRLFIYMFVVFFFLFFISPIWTGLITSFKTNQAVIETTPFIPPDISGLTLSKWIRAFDSLFTGLVNSFIMTIPATLLCVLFGSTSAYALTLIDWNDRIRFWILITFLFGIFVPYQPLIVPLADFWSNIFPLETFLSPVWSLPFLTNDYATLLELILTHTAFGIPICMLLFRSYYKSIPTELVESAKVDGASITSTYLKIILPLSKPMIGVVLIYQFTGIWNEFLFSLTLIESSSSPVATVQLVLAGIGADLTGVDFGLRMAAAFIAALPTIIIYVLFAEQFARGLRT